MSKTKISDRQPDGFISNEHLRRKIQDKLSRITIYFIKEDRSHPMYEGTWDDSAKLVQVDYLLHNVMLALHINPKAKSY